jgi:hypothetical protein
MRRSPKFLLVALLLLSPVVQLAGTDQGCWKWRDAYGQCPAACDITIYDCPCCK